MNNHSVISSLSTKLIHNGAARLNCDSPTDSGVPIDSVPLKSSYTFFF